MKRLLLCVFIVILSGCNTQDEVVPANQKIEVDIEGSSLIEEKEKVNEENVEESQEESANEKAKEVAEEIEPESEKVPEKGIHIDDFNVDIREEFTMKDRAGESYTVYLFSEDEEEYALDVTWAGGVEGDVITDGKYQFGIQKTASNFVVIQDILLPWLFNHDRIPYYVIENEPDVLFLRENLSSNAIETGSFFIDEEEIHEIEYSAANSAMYKKIEDNHFQHYFYNNEEGSWSFNTLQLNTEKRAYEIVETFQFQGDKAPEGEYIAGEFNSDDDFYVTEEPEYEVVDSSLNSGYFLERLKDGYLLDSDLHLGQYVDIEAELGQPDSFYENYNGPGADYYDYDSLSYLVAKDENQVIGIEIRPQAIGNPSYEEIRQIFGEPASEEEDMLWGGYLVNYRIGNRDLTFVFEYPQSNLLSLEIR